VAKNYREAKIGLKATTIWMFGEAVSYLVCVGCVLSLLLTGNSLSACLLVMADLALAMLVSMTQAGRIGVSCWKILKGLSYFYLLRPVNAFLFWKSLIIPKKVVDLISQETKQIRELLASALLSMRSCYSLIDSCKRRSRFCSGSFGAAFDRGILIVNVVPIPSLLSTLIVPP